MKYKEIYDLNIKRIRKTGIKVSHRKLPDSIFGHFNPNKNEITINTKIRYKKAGLITLFHEEKHAKDYKAGRFKRMFKGLKTAYNQKDMKVIIAGEQSAGRWAEKQCLKYGIRYKCEEKNPKLLPYLKKAWKDDYFHS